MNANEKIIVDCFSADTEEDSYKEGLIGGTCSSWSERELPINGRFDTIDDALKAVCDAHGFDFDINGWEMSEADGDFPTSFQTDVTVDVNNSEASDYEIEKWKKGEMKLWCCRLVVYLAVQTDKRELTESEVKTLFKSAA